MTTPEQASWLQRVLGVDVGASGKKGAPKFIRAIKKALTPPPPPQPVPRAEFGPEQQQRADRLLDAMTPADQVKVQTLLDRSGPDQKKYLQKALGTGHNAAELEAFSNEIAGKDAAWMQDNLHLVGNSEGRGIKQQWNSSCVPTTMQAIRGELDPIYALEMRKANPNYTKADDRDATKLNPAMAKVQADMLDREGSEPTVRSKRGDGLNMAQEFRRPSVKANLGMRFEEKSVANEGVDPILAMIDTALAKGLPVPAGVGRTGVTDGHAVLITGCEAGPPRRYAIHDPWTGKTVTVTDDQIKKKKLDVGGWPELQDIQNPAVIMPPVLPPIPILAGPPPPTDAPPPPPPRDAPPPPPTDAPPPRS